MNIVFVLLLFVGCCFCVCYDCLVVDNIYSVDGCYVQYVIVFGVYVGVQGEVVCEWQQISEGVYVILWLEVDGVLVVYVDDFVGGCLLVWFIVIDGSFYCMQGLLVVL